MSEFLLLSKYFLNNLSSHIFLHTKLFLYKNEKVCKTLIQQISPLFKNPFNIQPMFSLWSTSCHDGQLIGNQVQYSTIYQLKFSRNGVILACYKFVDFHASILPMSKWPVCESDVFKFLPGLDVKFGCVKSISWHKLQFSIYNYKPIMKRKTGASYE